MLPRLESPVSPFTRSDLAYRPRVKGPDGAGLLRPLRSLWLVLILVLVAESRVVLTEVGGAEHGHVSHTGSGKLGCEDLHFFATPPTEVLVAIVSTVLESESAASSVLVALEPVWVGS